MFKTILVLAALTGSASAFAAEINRDQLASEFKADMVATCSTKRAELQKMVTDPTPITDAMCVSVTEELWSGDPRHSISPVFDMIVKQKDDKAALKITKKQIETMEERFDTLQFDTVLARPALINLINKLLKN